MAQMQINSRPLEMARQANGWTYEKLSRVSDLSIATVHRVLAGKQVGVKSVHRIADVLGVPVSDLFTSPADPTGGPTNDTGGGHGPKGPASRMPAVVKFPSPPSASTRQGRALRRITA